MSILARAAATLVTAVVTTGVSACGSGGGEPVKPAAGLVGALASVSGSGAAVESFGYTDIARLRALGVIDPGTHRIDERWRTAASVGYRDLANVVADLPRVTGVDLTAADRTISVGNFDGRAVRIDGGFDATTVLGRIKHLGPSDRTFGGHDGYSFGGDDEMDGDSAIGAHLPVGNTLNQIVVRPGSFAGSSNGTALEGVLGGSHSLLVTANYRDIARCLGDVVAAVVWTPRDNANSVLLAAGVRYTGSVSRDHDEVVCAIPAPGRTTDVRAAFADNLSVDAVDPQFLIPNSRYVTASQFDTIGPAVRATMRVRHAADAGFVLEAYFDGAAKRWDGSV